MFVVRTVKHSFLSRAGTLTYVAFILAQVRLIACYKDCLASVWVGLQTKTTWPA